MKKFLRKINRGVLLGVLCLIAAFIYMTVYSFEFRKERPVIEDRLRSYLTELCDVNTAEEDVQLRMGRELLSDYWIGEGADAENLQGTTLETVLHDIEVLYRQGPDSYTEAATCLGILSNVRIRQAGMAGAMVDADYAMKVEMDEKGSFLSPSGIHQFTGKGGSTEGTLRYHLRVRMRRSSGKWRIISMKAEENIQDGSGREYR